MNTETLPILEDLSLQNRMAAHYADFIAAYQHLYPHAGQDRIDAVLEAVAEAYEQRAARLKSIDRLRAQDAAWFHSPNWVGMMLYVDLFSGDLKGVKEKIPYLKSLGITYLHLMPLLKPRTGPNDGGYAVESYRDVDPRLGTMADLHDLAEALHEEGMLLVIDYVMNHTAKEHEWAQAALKGDPFFQNFYWMYEDRQIPDQYESSLPEVFPDFAPGNFTWEPALNRWVWTTFYDFQWDLNYRNPDVFEAMLREMLFLANIGVDVLRLDAVPFLWKKMGTNCQNQPEVVHLLAAYKALMRMVAPGVLFKSEAIVAPEDIIKYLGSGGFEGKACEVGYNATLMNHLWHALACENTHLLRTTLSRLPAIPREATWINYIRCHDDIGWGISDENAAAVHQSGRGTRNFCTDFYTGVLPASYSEGYAFQRDRNTGEARVSGTAAALVGLQKAQVEADPAFIQAAIQRLNLLNGVIFFMRGIPLVFSGDEIGQLNDFGYLLDPMKAQDNRWTHRPPMNWAKAERRHIKGSVEQQVFDLHKALIQARKNTAALHGNAEDYILIPDNHHLFLCERTYAGGTGKQEASVLLVANFKNAPERLSLNVLPAKWQSGVFTECIRQMPVHYPDGTLLIPPYGVLWLQKADTFRPTNYQTIRLTVHVETNWGERVMLVGSNGALGNWDLVNGKYCASAGYPYWTCEVVVPEGEAFSYRWVRVREGRHVVQWGPETFFAQAGLS